MGRIWIALICAAAAWTADPGADLRDAARKGQTAQVAALLGKGAPIESVDKTGRTALMLAADKGHADTVKLLLERGAKPDARDRDGWTAYALAVIEQRDEVVKLFPPRPPIALGLDAKLSMENVYSSCFMLPQQLADQVAGMQPDAVVAAAVGEYAALHGKGVAKIVESGADAVLAVKARPGISCVQQQSRDNVSMAIDLRVLRSSDQAPLFEKTFGGGLTGLRARMVSGPNQYAALIQEWAKLHASQIYWAAVEAWLRAR
jgi:hypothetical protein